jgi:hypothetical protein
MPARRGVHRCNPEQNGFRERSREKINTHREHRRSRPHQARSFDGVYVRAISFGVALSGCGAGGGAEASRTQSYTCVVNPAGTVIAGNPCEPMKVHTGRIAAAVAGWRGRCTDLSGRQTARWLCRYNKLPRHTTRPTTVMELCGHSMAGYIGLSQIIRI